jgi:hypothetical protein
MPRWNVWECRLDKAGSKAAFDAHVAVYSLRIHVDANNPAAGNCHGDIALPALRHQRMLSKNPHFRFLYV